MAEAPVGLTDPAGSPPKADEPWNPLAERAVVSHSCPVTGWQIIPVPVPSSLGAPEAWAVHGGAAVRQAVELARLGHDDLAARAPEIISHLMMADYSRNVEVVAVPADVTEPTTADVVGYAHASLPLTSNPHLAYLGLEVHPAHRGHGAGAALLAEVERIALENGRSVLIAWTEQLGDPAPDDPAALRPPTGSGLVRGDEPGVLLALRRGYALEQAERYSVLQLPVEPALLNALHADALRRAGDAYRLHTWEGDVPAEWVEQFAVLRTRMSTDVPMAGLEIEEDPWDAARVRQEEEKARRSGHAVLTTAVEHVPTGALVGYSGIDYALDRPQPAFQGDTIVLRAHRGNRLGMLVKTAQLLRLPEVRPGAARIHTWNAEENERMLEINVALGFRPTGVVGMWQKRLG